MAYGWREQYNRYRGFFLNIVNLYKQRADLRAFTEVILSITTIVIFLLFALKPTALTIISLVKEINEKKETVASLDQKITNLQRARAVYTQNQNTIQGLEVAVSSRPSPDTISNQIVGLSAKNSVDVLGVSVGQIVLAGESQSVRVNRDLVPLPENAMEMALSLSILGDYQNLISFVRDFENLRISSKIDQVGIGSSETEGERVIVALISARVPYIEDKSKTNEKR